VEETYKNIVKFYILSGYSFMVFPVYLTAKEAILYKIVGFLILAIFLLIFFYFHSNVMKNVNKIISNNFWDKLLFAFALFSFLISFIVEESLFYMAIGYAILTIILLLIAIRYINK
jgi:hypothetical protein